MAPTETLAEQHFLTVEGICRDLGVRCELLTSSVPAAKRREDVRARLASGEAELAVGTHALIQEDVEFRSLAVAVVDEQHRFGVEQRRALGKTTPHVLHMTATPIPRTLAQTVYGDLDVTEIARPPANRKPVVTRWVEPRAEQQRPTRGCAGTSRTGGRRTSSARSSPSRRRSRRAPPSRRPSGCARRAPWLSGRLSCTAS